MTTFQIRTNPAERESYRFVEAVLQLKKAPFGYGDRYGICFIPEGDTGRQVTMGPLVPGPWAKTYGLSVVIAANTEMSTGAVSRRNKAAGIEFEVEEGDEIVVDGTVRFRVRLPKNHEIYRDGVIALDRIDN